MPAVNPCPPRDHYECLIQGELPPSGVERLSQHLASCSFCADAVQTLLGQDTLLSDLRGTPADSPGGAEVPSDLTQRLLALHSSSDLSSASSLLLPALKPPQRPDEIGRLAHYRVLKVLGGGGMGIVFLAEDVRLSRTVALKTMRPEVAADSRHRQRFIREARAAAKVEDDHIVPIYDVGEDCGVPWLAMPFLKGQSLDELLKRVKVLTPAQAARLGAQVAKGLAAAHAAGLIHRDVKPANIWVEPEGGGRAKLLDFGLARDQSPPREQGQEHLTRTGAVVGTPAFMAPEQARGKPLDTRADLFSLGCVLYRAVTGRLPFQGQGTMGTLVALATETPPAPDEVNPAVPPPLSALIVNLLAKERSARPTSAATVAAALEALQEKSAGPLPMAKPITIPAAPRRDKGNPWADLTEVAEPPATAAAPWRRRRVTAAALLLALGGMLAAGIVVVIIKNKDGQEVARVPVTVPEGGSVEIKPDGDGGKGKGDLVAPNPDRRAAEWVLSIGGGIAIRQDGQERNISAAKDLPAAPFEVVAVVLNSNPKADNAGLAHLKGLTNLMALTLRDAPVTDAGLGQLEGLTRLGHLDLGGTRISDAGLGHLKGLTNLTELFLYRTRVGDAGLVHLKGMTKLTEFRVDRTRVSGAGLKNLVGFPLRQLYLDYARLSAGDYANVRSAFPNTQLLGEPRPSLAEDLLAEGATLLIRAGEGQEDRPVKRFADLPREPFLVRRLDCTAVKKPLRELLNRLSQTREYEFERLEALDLSGCAITHLGVPDFAPPLEGLQELNLSGTDVAGLQPLLGLKRLRKLSLDRTSVSNLGPIAELPNLEELSLAGTPVADAAMQSLGNLPNLSKLDLNQTAITGRGVGRLAKLPKLVELSLAGSKVSDLLASELGAMTKLERLSLAGCTFSDAGLKLLAGLSHLTRLDLTGTQVTADGVAALQNALPKCKIVWDGNAKK